MRGQMGNIEVINAYIGYYKEREDSNYEILLCSGETLRAVKQYLREIRGLNKREYSIYEINCSIGDYYALYEEVELVPFQDVYLTNRDAMALQEESNKLFGYLRETYMGLNQYVNLIHNIKSMKDQADLLSEDLSEMLVTITNERDRKLLLKELIKNSPILSKDIRQYLSVIKYAADCEEMRDTFLRKISD